MIRTGYVSKELDAEGVLGDHGVRKYDNETGRFTCTDPYWDKYFGWSPYQYSRNNPITSYDDNGNFDLFSHTLAYVVSNTGGTIKESIENSLYDFIAKDILSGGNNNQHFDNKENYDQVMAVVSEAGGWDKLDNHQIGDFFSHSNYVDIWNQLKTDGKVEGEPPLPNEVDPKGEFAQALKENLRTTNYPDKLNKDGKEEDPAGHNTGYERNTNGAFGSKDSGNSDDLKKR